ncbi:MAG: TolC family protein [Melioribacteraceae bacterium]
MKRKKILFFLLFFTVISLSAQSSDSTLNRYINRALELSPKINLLQNKKSISGTKIAQLSNFPDPMLSFGVANVPINSFSFSQEPMTAKIIGLSQAVPFPGKLTQAEKVNRIDIDINQQEIDDARNEIRNEIRKAYYDLIFSREAIRISLKSKELLEHITAIIRAKYSVSKASQQNLIQVEVSLTKIQERIEELKGKENNSLAILNSYLLKNPFENIATDSIPEIKLTSLDFNELRTNAIHNRPFLKGISLAKEKSYLMEDLSKYDKYPNFNFSIQYSQRDKLSNSTMPQYDFLSFIVGLSLPVNYGGKTSAKIEEARLTQKMYENQYQTSIQLIDRYIGSSLAKINELQKREKLIKEGLLPQAQQSLNSALVNYQVGDIDFINVLDAQNKLYEIEILLYSIRIEYQKELSQIEFLTGTDSKQIL